MYKNFGNFSLSNFRYRMKKKEILDHRVRKRKVEWDLGWKIPHSCFQGSRSCLIWRIKSMFIFWLVCSINIPLQGTKCTVWQTSNYFLVKKVDWYIDGRNEEVVSKTKDMDLQKNRKLLQDLVFSVRKISDIRIVSQIYRWNSLCKKFTLQFWKIWIPLSKQIIRTCSFWHSLPSAIALRGINLKSWSFCMFLQERKKINWHLEQWNAATGFWENGFLSRSYQFQFLVISVL